MRTSRRGFTLVELLVAIAIIGILVALLMPAVQAARESARRTECLNNLKQLALATNNHENHYRIMPNYFGWTPKVNQGARGGWFVPLLPYVEQNGVYETIIGTGGDFGRNTNRTVITPASPNYQPGYWKNNGGYWMPTSTTTTSTSTQHVGHDFQEVSTTNTSVWVGPPNTWVPAVGTPPVYDTQHEYKGVDAASDVAFRVLRCYSDPGNVPPMSKVNWRYNQPWSLTNYQANFHAWTKPGGAFEPVLFSELTDGMSNTILFAEGMRYCDLTYRFSFWSDYKFRHSHNFGVDWNKLPNTWMFQSKARQTTCNNWRVQGNHAGSLAVALADGSTRTISSSISRRETSDPDRPQIGVNAVMGTDDQVWDHLLLPADGAATDQHY